MAQAYITAQNTSEETRDMQVPLEVEALGLQDEDGLRHAIWDINKGLGETAAFKQSSIQLSMEPGVTSVIVLGTEERIGQRLAAL